MNRRGFLQAALVSQLVLRGRDARGGDKTIESVPIRNIPPGFDVNSLAARYLSARPQYREPECLLQSILGRTIGHERNMKRASDRTAVLDLVSQSIAADFGGGAIWRIEGWMYAETELRLCALFALSSKQV
jgi:hypothetical protein